MYTDYATVSKETRHFCYELSKRAAVNHQLQFAREIYIDIEAGLAIGIANRELGAEILFNFFPNHTVIYFDLSFAAYLQHAILDHFIDFCRAIHYFANETILPKNSTERFHTVLGDAKETLPEAVIDSVREYISKFRFIFSTFPDVV